MLDFEKRVFENQYKAYKHKYLDAVEALEKAKKDSSVGDNRFMLIVHKRDMWGCALAELLLEHEGDILTCLLPETESDDDELPFM